MKNMKRRDFIGWLASGGAVMTLGGLGFPASIFAQAKGQRVVIVGGGFGGATAAKYLRRANPDIAITLVEREESYVTGPFSNTVLAGMNSLEDITLGYGDLRQHYKIDTVRGNVVDIDATAGKVMLEGGDKLAYDRLIVAPGIDFRYSDLEGYDEAASQRMPHAWKPGAQTLLLRSQLESMADGGTVIISVPQGPYRCPPGPYERAGLIAHYLKLHKPKSKVLVLDANEKFPKQELFMEGWAAHYGNMIEWVPISKGGRVMAVDSGMMTVETDGGRQKGDVINIIPPQKAGAVAENAGLTDSSGWCPVDQRSFESKILTGVHVIGDSAIAGKLPKSAAAANSEAKVCAMAVIATLSGQSMDEPSFINACYSLIAPDYGISVAGVFELTDKGIAVAGNASGTSPLNASQKYRRKEARDAQGWYDSIRADSFS